jgi:hypothetical protein
MILGLMTTDVVYDSWLRVVCEVALRKTFGRSIDVVIGS